MLRKIKMAPREQAVDFSRPPGQQKEQEDQCGLGRRRRYEEIAACSWSKRVFFLKSLPPYFTCSRWRLPFHPPAGLLELEERVPLPHSSSAVQLPLPGLVRHHNPWHGSFQPEIPFFRSKFRIGRGNRIWSVRRRIPDRWTHIRSDTGRRVCIVRTGDFRSMGSFRSIIEIATGSTEAHSLPHDLEQHLRVDDPVRGTIRVQYFHLGRGDRMWQEHEDVPAGSAVRRCSERQRYDVDRWSVGLRISTQIRRQPPATQVHHTRFVIIHTSTASVWNYIELYKFWFFQKEFVNVLSGMNAHNRMREWIGMNATCLARK